MRAMMAMVRPPSQENETRVEDIGNCDGSANTFSSLGGAEISNQLVEKKEADPEQAISISKRSVQKSEPELTENVGSKFCCSLDSNGSYDEIKIGENNTAELEIPNSILTSFTPKLSRASETALLNGYLDEVLQLTESSHPEKKEHAMNNLKMLTIHSDRSSLNPGLPSFLRKLYDRMERDANHDLLQYKALRLIAHLARETAWMPSTVAETGGIRIVVDTLANYQHSVSMQEQVLSTLRYLTTTDLARTATIDCKGAESICWAMNEFPKSKCIQVDGLSTLANLALTNQQRIGKIGGIDGIVRAMEHYRSDFELQVISCSALRHLTWRSRANQWIAGRALAMESIVLAMQSFPEELDVLSQGCTALVNLCSDEPENRARAMSCGAIDAVLTVLDSQVKNVRIVEPIFDFFSSLLRYCKDSQEEIGEQNCVKLVVSALRHHILHERVLINGCDVIRHLMFTGGNRVAVYNCGGVEALIRVLRECHEWRSVIESCLCALGILSFDFIESQIAIGRHGGIIAVVDCMSTHVDSSLVQEHGCRILRNVADSDDLNVSLLDEAGAIDSCIFACFGHPVNAQIQEHSLAMLCNMTGSDIHLQRMKGLDVDRLILQAQTIHSKSEAVAKQASALQSNIKAKETDQAALSSRKSAFTMKSMSSPGPSLTRKASKSPQGNGSPFNSFRRALSSMIGTKSSTKFEVQ